MSVVKSKRTLSDMEFYANAYDIRVEINNWLMRDFGYKKYKKEVKQLVKDISQEDEEIINDILKKYDIKSHNKFTTVYPKWFIKEERKILIKLGHKLMRNIIEANSIYPKYETEYELRRTYQDKAIGKCYDIMNEMQYISKVFKTDINRYVGLLKSLDREIKLLKAWRNSDKTKKDIT